MTTDKPKKSKSMNRGWLKYGNPPGDPSTAPRCGAKTRSGKPCKGPAIRGKRRCRLHGGNAGRKPDPKIQARNYRRIVRKQIKQKCSGCVLINNNCPKIFGGAETTKNFYQRINKYCQAS